MALRQVTTNNVNAWTNRTFFPKDNYLIRCIEEKFGFSSAGNPMITRDWEIVNQKPIRIGDKVYDLDGVKFRQYQVIKVHDEFDKSKWNPESSDKSFNQYSEYLRKLGYDNWQEWDDENPPLVSKGKVVHACLYGKEKASFASPTPEEQAEGKKIGKPIVDPLTGKEQIVYDIVVENIYGLFNGEVSTAESVF